MTPFTLIDRAFLLRKTRLFAGLDLDILLAISDKASVVEFQAGDEIFDFGQAGNHMYLVISGDVHLHDEEGHRFASLGPLAFFGDEAVFNRRSREHKASAAARTRVLALSKSHLLAIIAECPSVAVELLQVYASAITPSARHTRGSHDPA